jgi:hypothetical protein
MSANPTGAERRGRRERGGNVLERSISHVGAVGKFSLIVVVAEQGVLGLLLLLLFLLSLSLTALLSSLFAAATKTSNGTRGS